MSEETVTRTEQFVREYMGRYDCSHDWQHVRRVVDQALALAKAESARGPVDMLVVQLAALLHDVDDAKYKSCSDAPFSVANFLADAGLDSDRAVIVARIVDAVSFRKELQCLESGSEAERAWRSGCVELACVQDADRLDAIGAFGILRCAAFSGARNRPLHILDDTSSSAAMTYSEYIDKGSGSSAVAHFHEKLLRLAAMMKTEHGRREAQRRHKFLLRFLEQVDSELGFGAGS
ncbi:hypothetical protein GGF46_002262 [Coemansia sp. RSA 552]|nr:hypothetical protein GGF46_002262 [Coemansia sp. RSA 552]